MQKIMVPDSAQKTWCTVSGWSGPDDVDEIHHLFLNHNISVNGRDIWDLIRKLPPPGTVEKVYNLALVTLDDLKLDRDAPPEAVYAVANFIGLRNPPPHTALQLWIDNPHLPEKDPSRYLVGHLPISINGCRMIFELGLRSGQHQISVTYVDQCRSLSHEKEQWMFVRD